MVPLMNEVDHLCVLNHVDESVRLTVETHYSQGRSGVLNCFMLNTVLWCGLPVSKLTLVPLHWSRLSRVFSPRLYSFSVHPARSIPMSDAEHSPASDRDDATTATSTAPKGSTSGKKRDREDEHWDLTKNKRVSISSFKGKQYVDIREFYEKDGKLLPGKKGISLSVEQWKILKSVIDEIDETLSEK